ncbi:beta-N-acetylhexosaminidase [Bauldia sp.]|uniref:beta-N-acetylhexosaminidase n=1 Tax=Bauldia sp. TaxID=2575872 RepID=UPI003BAA46BE
MIPSRIFVAPLLAIVCWSTTATGNPDENAQMRIERVATTPGSQPADYSLDIELSTLNIPVIADWRFGFYMPRTFNQLTSGNNAINPNLKMAICVKGTTTCADLAYVKQGPSGADALVYGDGYSNVLAPAAEFRLEANTTYHVSLADSNQWPPANLSSLPQSFFLYDVARNNYTLANAPLSAYGVDDGFLGIGGYDAAKTQAQIAKHVKENWQRSRPLDNQSPYVALGVVPTPTEVSAFDPTERLDIQSNTFSFSSSFQEDYFGDYVSENLDMTLSPSGDRALTISQSATLTDPEAYSLTISADGIAIEARDAAGAFYAIQTLRQLTWLNPDGLPHLQIFDKPRFEYRGVMRDVARHYASTAGIKKTIDLMAALKLNTLHIHFADDEGWRLLLPNSITGDQIDTASTRGYRADGGTVNPPALYSQANTDVTNYVDFNPEAGLIEDAYPQATTQYKKYYTPEEIQEIIAYANANYITVIPEIDLPGHARALVHSQPELFMNPEDKSSYISVQGYYNNVVPVCLYNGQGEQARQFTAKMNQIIEDINDLFQNQDTPYHQREVSVGGDEVPASSWSDDASCEGQLTALQRSQQFFKRLQQSDPNLKLSGWQQFVQGDDGTIDSRYALSPEHVGRVWAWEPASGSTNGIQSAATLADAGYPVVLAFADHLYFDLTYTPDAWEPGLYWAGSFLDTHAALSAALSAQKVLDRLDTAKQRNVIGLEGTLWSEYVLNDRHAEYMMLPKVTGLAEAAWGDVSHTAADGKVGWQSLAHRLGTDNTGLLGYLHTDLGFVYRGMPNGISKETD